MQDMLLPLNGVLLACRCCLFSEWKKMSVSKKLNMGAYHGFACSIPQASWINKNTCFAVRDMIILEILIFWPVSFQYKQPFAMHNTTLSVRVHFFQRGFIRKNAVIAFFRWSIVWFHDVTQTHAKYVHSFFYPSGLQLGSRAKTESRWCDRENRQFAALLTDYESVAKSKMLPFVRIYNTVF